MNFFLVRHVTADLFLAISNPFEPRPANGWCFSLQTTCRQFKNYSGVEPPNFSASKTALANPDLVRLFEKRLWQKFEARWVRTTTLYHRHDAEKA